MTTRLKGPEQKSSTLVALAIPLVLGLGLWLLWPGIFGPFVFDDFPNLQNLRKLGDQFTRESIGRYLAAWQGNPGRPLAALSFLIEDHAWPTDPEAFKRNNLLWHLLVGIGVFTLARKLAGLYASGRPYAEWIGLASMTLWLIHPMQLSATMLVVQRMTVFSNGLIVAGLIVYLSILGRTAKPNMSSAVLALAALAAFGGLAFLAKENGPLIFAYATALNLTLAAPLVARFPALPRRLLWLGTAGMTTLLAFGLLWQVRDFVAAYATRDFDLWQRLLTQSRILFDYLADVLLPSMSTTAFHDDYTISRGLVEPWSTLPAVLAIGIAIVLAWRFRQRFPLFSFAVFWFLAGHLIESTVIPLELYFEHRNYLAMLGPIFAISTALISSRGDIKQLLRAVLLIWIGLTALVSHTAAKTWGNAMELAEVWKLENPHSTRATQFLASQYAERGFYDDAREILERGRQEIPEADEFSFQKALLDCIYGHADEKEFERLIEIATQARRARIVPDVLAALRPHVQSRQCGDTLTPDRYRRLVDALLSNPAYSQRAEMVAHLHYLLAELYLKLDRPEEALRQFQVSWSAVPDPQVAVNAGQIALYLGDHETAQEELKKARNSRKPVFKEFLYPLENQIGPLEKRLDSFPRKSRKPDNDQ